MQPIARGLIVMLALLAVAAPGRFAFAAEAEEDAGKTLVNVDKRGLALQGYDPVAYFTDHKAVEGDKAITSAYRGATYRFASEEHKAMFEKEPKKYTPQFGGFCAWAVSKGYTAKIDPEAFMIADGRLLLQYDKSVLKMFSEDTKGNLAKADANWPKLVEKKGK